MASIDKMYFQIINVIIAFLILVFSMRKHSGNKKIYSYFIFIVPVLLFSTIQYLNPMVITLFIERNVDRQYLGLIISPQWVQLISTAAIIIGGPSLCFVLERIRKSGVNINPARLFSCGLILLGLSLLVIATGIMLTKNNELVNFNWILASTLIQGVAELFIAPIGFAMIANIAPSNSRGVMMGNWLLLLNIGAIFAGYISNMISNIGTSFLLLGSFSAIFGAGLFHFSRANMD